MDLDQKISEISRLASTQTVDDRDSLLGFRSVTEKPRHALAKVKDRVTELLFDRLAGQLADANIDENQLRTMVREELVSIVESSESRLDSAEQSRIVKEVLDDVLGYGPIGKFLIDPEVTEIMVNGPDHVFIEKSGRIFDSKVRFASERHLRKIIERIVLPIGRRIDESSPMVDARLPDGSRVNAILPPLSVGGSCLTIRKFSREAKSIQELEDLGSLNDNVSEFLKYAVVGKLNVLLSGGTGTGKTTLLNAMSSFIPSDERIITIEDSVELQLQQPHVVRLETRSQNVEGKGEVTVRDLVRNSLRMRPDRLIIGEVRGPEALDMLQAMNTGHSGSLSTIHANSTNDALSRLETLTLLAGTELPLSAVRSQVASAIDLIVQLARFGDGSRRIVKITELQGLKNNEYQIVDLFVRERGASGSGVIPELLPTGNRPSMGSFNTFDQVTFPDHLFGGMKQ